MPNIDDMIEKAVGAVESDSNPDKPYDINAAIGTAIQGLGWSGRPRSEFEKKEIVPPPPPEEVAAPQLDVERFVQAGEFAPKYGLDERRGESFDDFYRRTAKKYGVSTEQAMVKEGEALIGQLASTDLDEHFRIYEGITDPDDKAKYRQHIELLVDLQQRDREKKIAEEQREVDERIWQGPLRVASHFESIGRGFEDLQLRLERGIMTAFGTAEEKRGIQTLTNRIDALAEPGPIAAKANELLQETLDQYLAEGNVAKAWFYGGLNALLDTVVSLGILMMLPKVSAIPGQAALGAKGLGEATKAILVNASRVAVWSALSAPGTGKQRLKRGLLTGLYLSTPVAAQLAPSVPLAKSADFLANTFLSIISGQYGNAYTQATQIAAEKGEGGWAWLKYIPKTDILRTVSSDAFSILGTRPYSKSSPNPATERIQLAADRMIRAMQRAAGERAATRMGQRPGERGAVDLRGGEKVPEEEKPVPKAEVPAAKPSVAAEKPEPTKPEMGEESRMEAAMRVPKRTDIASAKQKLAEYKRLVAGKGRVSRESRKQAAEAVAKLLSPGEAQLLRTVAGVEKPGKVAEAMKRVEGKLEGLAAADLKEQIAMFEQSEMVRVDKEIATVKEQFEKLALSDAQRENRADTIEMIRDLFPERSKYRYKYLMGAYRAKTNAQFLKVQAAVQNKAAQEAERLGVILQRIEHLRAQRDLKKLVKTATDSLPTMRPEFQKPLAEILEGIDIAKMTGKKKMNLESLRHYIETHPDNNVPPDVLAGLGRLSKTAVADMKPEEVDHIGKMLQLYMKLNKNKNKLLVGREVRELTEDKDEILQNIDRYGKTPDTPEIITSEAPERKQGLASRYAIWHRNLERSLERWGGRNGKMVEYFQHLKDGIGDALRSKFGNTDKLLAEMKEAGIDPEADFSDYVLPWHRTRLRFEGRRPVLRKFAARNTIKTPHAGPIKLTKGQQVALLLLLRDANNNDAVKSSGFTFEENQLRAYDLSDADIAALRDVMNADPVVVKLADIFGRWAVDLGKQMNPTSVDLYGFEKFTNPTYWPVHRAQDFIEKGLHPALDRLGRRAIENAGWLKERVGGKNPIVLVDAFREMASMLHETGQFIGITKPMRNLRMLLGNSDVANTLKTKYGRHWYNEAWRQLDRIEGSTEHVSDFDRAIKWLIAKGSQAILPFSPGVVAKQQASRFFAATEIEWEYLGKHIADVAGPEQVAEMMRLSPFIRERVKAAKITRVLSEIADRNETYLTFTGRPGFSSRLFAPLEASDSQALWSVWQAVKDKLSATRPELAGEEYVRELAREHERIIRRTQNVGAMEDRAFLASKPQAAPRIAAVFGSESANMVRAIEALAYNIKRGELSGKRAIGSVAGILGSLVFAGAVQQTMRRWNAKREEDRKWNNFPTDLLAEVGRQAAGNYFLVGEVERGVEMMARRNWTEAEVGNIPMDYLKDVATIIGLTVQGVAQEMSGETYKTGQYKGQRKSEKTWNRLLRPGLSVTSKTSGVPIEATWRNIASTLRFLGVIETTGAKKKPKQKKEKASVKPL